MYVWIVLLEGGYDLPEAFGLFAQNENAQRFAAVAREQGIDATVVAVLQPDEFEGWNAERKAESCT